ncbi:MAG: DUF1893 domain-containing protein [Atribacterota bacterium]
MAPILNIIVRKIKDWLKMANVIVDLKKAKEILLNSRFTFVLLKDGEIKKTSHKRGVIPFMEIIRENDQILEDAIIADKVIGKATALLAAGHKAKAIYAEIISQKAREILDHYSIYYRFNHCVDYIMNRNKNGQCPMEKLTWELEDPSIAYQNILKYYQEVLKIDL